MKNTYKNNLTCVLQIEVKFLMDQVYVDTNKWLQIGWFALSYGFFIHLS